MRKPPQCFAQLTYVHTMRPTKWDAQFEKALNVIDTDTPSKLMITTRIKGLLEDGNEVELDLVRSAASWFVVFACWGLASLPSR